MSFGNFLNKEGLLNDCLVSGVHKYEEKKRSDSYLNHKDACPVLAELFMIYNWDHCRRNFVGRYYAVAPVGGFFIGNCGAAATSCYLF